MGGGLKLDQRKGDNSILLNPRFLKDRDNVSVISASLGRISVSGLTVTIVVPVNAIGILIKLGLMPRGKATGTFKLRED